MQEKLVSRLETELGTTMSLRIASALTQEGLRSGDILALLDELEDISAKVARAAVSALPDLESRKCLSLIIPWLDVAVTLAGSSGATALKYLKDSPIILGVIEPENQRAAVLARGLEIAEQDANVALEFLRTAPRLSAVLPASHVGPWLEAAVELTQADVVVGLEYVRQIPELVPVLQLDDVRDWLAFGMKLVTPNTLGKPDYMATMEFLRTSPAILKDVEHLPSRSKVVRLGTSLADRSPEIGITWLSESPRLLRDLPSGEWQMRVLQHAALLAERDADATLAFLRRCPEVLGLIGQGAEAVSRFSEWFKTGMEVLAYSSEGARAYFAVESGRALSAVEQALSGVSLRQVSRKVKLFVQGLCGTDVAIVPLPDSVAAPAARASVSADGRTIALPALLRRYSSADKNERLYLVMAAHEAGHLEFGTYRLRLDALRDVIEALWERYLIRDRRFPVSLAALFAFYPHPKLIRDIWTVLEDARVEHRLRTEYPGLSRDLAQLADEAIVARNPSHGLTAKELIVDCLLKLSSGRSEESSVPYAVKQEVSSIWRLCDPVFKPDTTAEELVRVAHKVYVRLEELLASKAEMISGDRTEESSQDQGAGPAASEESGEPYRPVTNWEYRGELNPEFVTGHVERTDKSRPQPETQSRGDAGASNRNEGGQADRSSADHSLTGDLMTGGRSLPSSIEELLSLESRHGSEEQAVTGERTILYSEWDHGIRDYRVNWCRVIEKPAEAGSDDGVAETLASHRSMIRSLRRVFESLRVPASRRLSGRSDGEDIDLDALVRRTAEQRAGLEGDDRIYIRREKHDRQVAVAFLVDVSGSTARQVDQGRRVIDIERESLIVLCEAMEAIGDQYALFAYSGQGRRMVDVHVIKDFGEHLGPLTAARLGGLGPRQQNRDGAAIRHAIVKLKSREAKTRLLILLSDGRPLDGEYKDEYSLEDTKVALREARQSGIDTFCVTIDREADQYLRRMYGEVRYTVIDRIESLPARLPLIYQRLTA
ncbi:hypothetical protein W02_18130 [Nitrospira sp. KM1]|uniref:nitric oxide reductase activation protein NorD n=1 Tax=Nitrospira sp. KM1 TaxID=1936990 RepID=UPI0013A79305|nr:VWA domain-containing protein [Nitrospira sp. KM1]BCA54673.1 hypothetical protein W02_18130 [Nitrospira sp. KM1]